GVTLNALIAANPQITDPNRIFPGQQICIPGPVQPPTCMPPNFIYIVQPGDTLFSIAQRFGTTVQAILALNPQITDPNLIFPGQQICIPGPVQPQFPVCTFRLTPTALAGNSTALAYLDFGRNLVAVVASGLPKLALGVNYFAWLTDGAPTVRIPLELAQGGDSRTLFVGTACPTVNICRFSTILITRDVPQATTPGTDVFFRGNIRQQCGVTSTP
ncbi:MAG: LysM peptidoglycan-binding domain-containing protein, partial [Firmicutes bacterium]|nr:LysM peptidoglycan-binding domain-containing protein [Bacillota bacterium]